MEKYVKKGLFRDGIYLAVIVVIELLWLLRNQIGISSGYESPWFIVLTFITSILSLLAVMLVMYLIRELEDIFVEVKYYYYCVFAFAAFNAFIQMYHSFNYTNELARGFEEFVNIVHFTYILVIAVFTLMILLNEDIRKYIKVAIAIMSIMTILSTKAVTYVVLKLLDHNVGMSAATLQAYDTTVLIIDYVIIVCTITIIYFCDKE